MKTTKQSIMTSLVALLVLISMFVGTTFAWFTDIVTSKDNVIQAGMLDANMYWSEELLDTDSDQWIDASAGPVFNHELWEPGYTQVRYVKVQNDGNLNFKWMLSLAADGKVTELSDVIDVYYIESPTAAIDSLDGLTSKGNLTDVLEGNISCEGSLKPDESCILAIAFHMDELAGNEYQGMTLCEAGFSLKLIATQATGEFDSFDDQYDSNAEWPYVAINYSVAESVAEKIDTTGNLTEDVKIGEAGDIVSAEVPAGVKLAAGAEKLTLKVESMEAPSQQLDLERGEVGRSIDVHVEGVADDNTTPMLVTLNKLFSAGMNYGNTRIVHIQDGTPVEMTQVENLADLDVHNEFYYDVNTGDVIMSVASFSEYEVIEKDYNPWNGRVNTSWYDANNSEFTLTNADQLAGFGAIVDGGYNNKNNETDKDEGWVSLTQDSFEGKTIRLGEDIDLGGTLSFNPIGYSYSYKGGQVFKGTFDGQNHTISNLYVNGWDLGLSYSMAGGGFFASVEDATIKNVTFSNANIVMECIEQGVVAGLAAGNCTFDNINIYGCKVANYQRATGGVVGEVNPYRNNDGSIKKEVVTHTFTNINIDSTTVIGSMWGDFDAPVGGVIGAKWDDDVNVDGKGVTQVVMKNVQVACRLDVYNDVTSTYQWYAYRRAGMLIGNTEEVAADGRTAKADFLTCEKDNNGNNTVFVYYGENWRNYHYCEFSDYNPSWPFVRVEAGEHCTAFSNPRWGVPELDGIKVTPENHPITEEKTHANGNACMVLLPFEQLYGGGQGVYGDPTHDGVTVKNYAYSIQYINDNKVLAETFVESNSSEYKLDPQNSDYADAQKAAEDWVKSQDYNKVEFGGWVNAGSTKVTSIPAGNTETIKLYPYFNSPYTARFVDQNGNVLAWCLFHSEKTGELENTRALAEKNLVFDEGFSLDKWEVHVTDDNGNVTTREDYSVGKFAGYTTDVTVYPVYKFNGDVSLIPVDSDGDGDTDYYQVAGYGANTGAQELVEIPGIVNGVPVTTINADAFSSYDDLHSVRIPGTITEINSQSFTADNTNQWGTQRDTITMYYEGDPTVWNDELTKYENNHNYNGMFKPNWDNCMGDGSRVFFLVNGKVDNTQYWELNSSFKWVHHNHAYSYEAALNCNGGKGHYEYGGGFFGIGASLQKDEFTNYAGNCDCKSCGGATRPDAEYWTPVATTEEN